MDESDWDPTPSVTARRERAAVRVEVHEVKLREKVKAAGARWDSERPVSYLAMEQVLQLGLDGRVVSVEPTAPLTGPAHPRKEV